MNKSSIYMALVVGLALTGVFMSESSSAASINGNYAGGVDTLISSAPKVGSPDSEALWVQGELGDATIDWSVSIQNVTYYQDPFVSNIWGFALDGSPEYFLVKNSNLMALYQNNPLLSWAVIDVNLLDGGLNIPTDPWVISHVTELSGTGGGTDINTVPAPGAFFLFASGLGLLGFTRAGKKPSS